MTKNSLDIILPCYNPCKNWERNVVLVASKLEKAIPEYAIHIIIVNDGSTLGVEKKHIKFLENNLKSFKFLNLNQNLGKGAAIRQGFLESKADFSIFTDIDFPYQETNLFSMVKKLELGADLVLGIRNQEYYKKVPFIRKFISRFFKKIIRIIFRIPSSDTQAGLKAFSKKGKTILLETKINRYLFDLELVKRANNAKLKFAFVNLDLKDNIKLSTMSLKILAGEIGNLLRIIFL